MTRAKLGWSRPVKPKDDAELGDYTIELAEGRASMNVMVSVTGPTTMVDVYGDLQISESTGLGRYTVKASDANGNVPTDLYGDHDDDEETPDVLNKKVLVAVRVDGARVLGIDQDTGEVTLDKNGEATFTVQMPQDAVAGTTVAITVYISGTDITDTVIAMYRRGWWHRPRYGWRAHGAHRHQGKLLVRVGERGVDGRPERRWARCVAFQR